MSDVAITLILFTLFSSRLY